jgi:hypothetical protein
MAELGIDPQTAQIKANEMVDLTVCKRLGGEE